jgi:hypothetical protein
VRDDLRRLTGTGIIPNEYLQGIQTTMSAELKNPTTIIEFAPGGEPVRTDSRLLIFNLHGACRKFREYTDGFCLDCDNHHACLFQGLRSNNAQREVLVRASQCVFIREYREEPDITFGFVHSAPRPCLEYDCPLLGYRELLFPVFFDDKVIATFFLGELTLAEKRDFILAKQQRFLGTDPKWRKWLLQYCSDSGENPERIVKEIVDAHAEWIKGGENVLTEPDLHSLIERAHAQLCSLEKTLEEQMSLLREKFVRERVDARTRAFRLNLPREDESSAEKWTSFWTNVSDRLKELVTEFHLEYAVFFAASRQSEALGKPALNVVAFEGTLPETMAKAIQSGALKFKLGELPGDLIGQWTTSRDHPRMLKAVAGCSLELTEDANLIRLFSVSFYSRAHLAVLVGYHADNPAKSPENRGGSHLDRALHSFYTVVLHAYSTMLADEAEEKMTDALRIFGHETGQITSGLDWLRRTYLDSSRKLRSLEYNKAADLSRDVNAFIRLMDLLFIQANMLLKIPSPKKEKFWTFRDLFFKWKDIYRVQAGKKKLQFDICHPDPNDKSRPPMYADPALIEQLLYNLISNAVKYCYEGTKIYIDCRLKSTIQTSSPHVITVTNYGRRVDSGSWAYELHKRGDDVRDEEGLGVGLYVAQQIARAHGGVVEHRCRQISAYNVPLIVPYLDREFTGRDILLPDILECEIERLESELGIDLRQVVALSEDNVMRYDPDDVTLRSLIDTPTYEVTFQAYIPGR